MIPGIEFRERKKGGHWSEWQPCDHGDTLGKCVEDLLMSPGTLMDRLAWKASYGTVFEYRRKEGW